ncbi:MAG: DUF2235 domain-containing protein [Colwellia sp.]|nr:DUF2235 domain-containing protein [Colwellia sp.]
MPKNLHIFNFDGTGNEPEDANQEVKYKAKKEDDNISNVLKLHLMMGGNLYQKGSQYGSSTRKDIENCFYYKGVGTYGGWLSRIVNQGVALEGCDVASIMNKAINDFKTAYKKGDTVIISGFSRGAALARRFVTLVDQITASNKPKPFVFLCVFDTVACIGIPNLNKSNRPDYDVVFENGCTLSNIVVQAAHMLSLDDKRSAFQPTLMNKDPERITEIWFAGAHSDVGGGYYRDGLSDIALGYAMKWLHFMSKKPGLSRYLPAIKLRIPDDEALKNACPDKLKGMIGVDDLQRNPDPMAKNHQQDRWPVLDWLTLDDRVFCVIDQDKIDANAQPILHWSVAVRLHRDSNYRPKSVANVKHRVWYDFSNPCVDSVGLNEHIHRPLNNWQVLNIGEQAVKTIEADALYNYTGIMMEKNSKYKITAESTGQWYDATIDCGADGWTRASESLGLKEAFIAAAEPFRRVSKANWFQLCGSIGSSDENAKKIGCSGTFIAGKSGEFTAFANDLESKYGNNSGSIEITIKRVV